MTLKISCWISAAILSLLSTVALANPLQINLSQGELDGTINVEVTNTGKETLSVLRWDTPFEATLSHDVFQITTSAKALPFVDAASYIGRHAKRSAPTADNFLTLRPGESRTASVQLAEYYDIAQQSLYSVRFVGEIQHLVANKKRSTSRLEKELYRANNSAGMNNQALISNEISVALSPLVSSRILPPSFNECSADQEAYIQSATQAAEELTNIAVTDLQSLSLDERGNSPRYATWFGAYTAPRFERVLENFQALSGALANETIRYDCTCDEAGVFAYVFPIRPYDIFLCPQFHAAAEVGTDSRAGTIIHELSHFNVVAGTDDHIYSQQGAQSLAGSDPDLAIDNADSHEYFAENTPTLPIRSDGTVPPATEFTSLSLNTTVTGNVSEGTSDFYQASGVDNVALLSTSGDADLNIFSDSQLTQVLCQSSSAAPDDQCELFTDGTVYIQVLGFSDAQYTLEATGQDTVTTNPATMTLALDSPVSDSVAAGDRILYQVTGTNLVTLESITGDADLYIFSSPDFEDNNLVCSSILVPSDGVAEDACALPDTASTYYVIVAGWTNASFVLTATATETVSTQPVVLTPFGTLNANEEVSRFVEEQTAHIYTATGITVFELTSLSGDADLLIFDGPIEDGGEAICISDAFSRDSTLDSCDVSSSTSTTFEIAVFGYSASDYTLVGRVAPDDQPGETIDPGTPVETVDPLTPVTPDSPIEPVNPVEPVDPTIPSSLVSGGSSSGGSLGFLWLFAGLAMAGLRYHRRLTFQP